MVIARSYIVACGRRAAATGASHRARRCRKKEHAAGSESCCLSCRAGCPVRALRPPLVLRVHWASTQVLTLVLLSFGVNREGGTGGSVNSSGTGTGGARASQPTQIDATDRPGARVQGSHRDGSSQPLEALMHAARRVERLLRKLTARTSLLRGVRRGGRRVLPRHGDGPVLGVVLGDLVDRVL